MIIVRTSSKIILKKKDPSTQIITEPKSFKIYHFNKVSRSETFYILSLLKKLVGKHLYIYIIINIQYKLNPNYYI